MFSAEEVFSISFIVNTPPFILLDDIQVNVTRLRNGIEDRSSFYPDLPGELLKIKHDSRDTMCQVLAALAILYGNQEAGLLVLHAEDVINNVESPRIIGFRYKDLVDVSVEATLVNMNVLYEEPI